MYVVTMEKQKMWKRNLYLLLLSILPLMICTGMIYSVLSIYIMELGASRTEIGMIFTIGAGASAVMAPFLGKMSDRYGRKPLLLFSMAGFFSLFVAYGLIREYTSIFYIQVVEGIAWVGFGAATTALVADYVPLEKRGWAMGLYNQSWSIGWLVGPIVGGFLADQIGFRLTFGIGAGLILLGFLFVVILIPEPKQGEKVIPDAQ